MAADGSVVFSIDADDKEAQAKLNQLRRDIDKTAKAMEQTGAKKDGITRQLEDARAAAAKTAEEIERVKASLAENQKALAGESISRTKGMAYMPIEDYQALKETVAEQVRQRDALTTNYTKQQAEVTKLEGQEKKVLDTLKQQTAQLEQQKREAGAVERSLAGRTVRTIPDVSGAVQDMSKSMKKGFRNILKWGFGIRSTFILMRRLRSAIKEGVNAFAEQDEETKKNITGLKTALQTLKVSWGAAFAPILNAVAPILQKLIAWLTTAANAVQQFFNVLSGKSTYKAVKANEALADSYGAAGGAAEKASKQLMGFDEINKLNDNESGGGGGSQNAYEIEELPISDKFQTIAQMVKDNLAAIEFTLGTSLLGLGAILAFSGANIPLGLGLMALGALSLGKSITENWSGISDRIKSSIFEIATIVGISLMAIGAILAFSGVNIPLGIGLMAAGAISVGAVALNWGNMTANIQKNVADIMAVLTGALLAVGAILTFSGVNPALGIGLMLAGGLSLATAVALNWNRLPQMLRGPLGLITTIAGGFLLALGLVLALSGAGVGLGVALMAVGGATLYAGATNYSWTGLLDKIKEAWKAIKDYWNEHIAKYFTLSYWQDKLDSVFGKIQFPQIKLPHVTVTWEAASGWMAQALNFFGIPASLPHIAVDWYAKGGIVDGATLIGAGEAGKEAIVPLEKNTGWINMVANGIVDSLTSSNKLEDYVSGLELPSVMQGQIVPPRALNGGGSIFTDGDIERLVNGITAALAFNDSEERTPVIIDGRTVAEIVTKHQRHMERGYA